jgi:predicted transcriptional regulator
MNAPTRIPVAEVKFREDLYPRIKADPATIQRYAEDLNVLPPIEVNQHHELIDGYHRWTAHRKAEAETIAVTVTPTESDVQLLALACERNAKHGLQLSEKDKASMAVRLYHSGAGLDEAAIANALSVSGRMVRSYLSDVKDHLRRQQRERVFALWMRCWTQEQIAGEVGLSQMEVSRIVEDSNNLEALPNSLKLAAAYQDADWQPPLYDVWTMARNNNETKHFGNTAVEFVDNLLYTFTEPFDVVIDPFAGGGSTLDVCLKRLRRCWVSDRKPIVEREADIRCHDLATEGVSGPSRWSDVALVYLDPPYWRQAQGQYSDDPTDLANMPLEQFTSTLVAIIHDYAAKLKPGAHIACIISPTQWPNEDKRTVYHDLDLARLVTKKLVLERRVSCPYSTQQYNGTQVDIAKQQKLWLTLTRTMLVWRRT